VGHKAGERMVLPIPVEMRQEENNRVQNRDRLKQVADQQLLRFMDKDVEELFGTLIALNRDEARNRGLAPYMVIPITVLESLARLRPTTEARFRAIEGIDDHKAHTYAATFTRAIQVCPFAFRSIVSALV
jgi:superfamily II DNA helicase RecQ